MATTMRRGKSLTEIAAAGDTSHTNVRRALVAAFPNFVGRGRGGVPHDVGELLATTFRMKVLTRHAAQKLGTDPAEVLSAAEALAALARMALEDQQKTGAASGRAA
ncbi:hypothetical protein ACF1HU_35900 [Streptomyces olivaceus]|uniref:hypothetical protein n=1 Tax=Streptomyces olivaceus TaxID=47716 RepID=UPI0036FC95AD